MKWSILRVGVATACLLVVAHIVLFAVVAPMFRSARDDVDAAVESGGLGPDARAALSAALDDIDMYFAVIVGCTSAIVVAALVAGVGTALCVRSIRRQEADIIREIVDDESLPQVTSFRITKKNKLTSQASFRTERGVHRPRRTSVVSISPHADHGVESLPNVVEEVEEVDSTETSPLVAHAQRLAKKISILQAYAPQPVRSMTTEELDALKDAGTHPFTTSESLIGNKVMQSSAVGMQSSVVGGNDSRASVFCGGAAGESVVAAMKPSTLDLVKDKELRTSLNERRRSSAMSHNARKASFIEATIWDNVEHGMDTTGTVIVIDLLTKSYEETPDTATAESLTQVVTQLIHAIVQHDGVILTFNLHSIVATFNLQSQCADHCLYGVYAALACHDVLEGGLGVDPEITEIMLGVPWGIALSSGRMLGGFMGTDDVRSYTVAGPAMYVAEDLVKLNYVIGTKILLTESIVDAIQSQAHTIVADIISIPTDGAAFSDGTPATAQPVFELRTDETHIHGDVLRNYLDGFTKLRTSNFQAAREVFDSMVNVLGSDEQQVNRMQKLAVQGCRYPDSLPKPLVRTLMSWNTFSVSADVSIDSPFKPMPLTTEALQMNDANASFGKASVSFTPTSDLASTPNAVSGNFDRRESLHSNASSVNFSNQPKRSFAVRRDTQVGGPSRADLSLAIEREKEKQQRQRQAGRENRGRTPEKSTSGYDPLGALMGTTGDEESAPEEPLPAVSTVSNPDVMDFSYVEEAATFTDTAGNTWMRSEKILGTGAFGQVLLGIRPNDGRLVALKTLKIPDAEKAAEATPARRRRPGQKTPQEKQQEELNNLIGEIQMLSGLRHANIVAFFGCAVVNMQVLIAMEYVPGGSLMDVVEHFGALPVSSVQRYLKDSLRGLQFLHAKKIVHRDVKPHNILLNTEGTCKLTDFGTSTQMETLAGKKSDVVGTPLYTAPEQAKGMATFASDIWSVGIMTVQLLTAKPPYVIDSSYNPHNFMFRLINDDTFNPVVPTGLSVNATEFIKQCLNRNPEDRPTADQLLLDPFLMSSIKDDNMQSPLQKRMTTRFARSCDPKPKQARVSSDDPLFEDLLGDSTSMDELDVRRVNSIITSAPPRPPQSAPASVNPRKTQNEGE